MTLIPLTAKKITIIQLNNTRISNEIPSSGFEATPRLLYDVIVTNLFDLITPFEETFFSFTTFTLDGVFVAEGTLADVTAEARLDAVERVFNGAGGCTGRKGRGGGAVDEPASFGVAFAFFVNDLRGGATTGVAASVLLFGAVRVRAGALGDLGVASFTGLFSPLSFLITVGYRRGLFLRTVSFL